MKNYSLYSSQKFLPDGNIAIDKKSISNHYSHTHCHDYFELEVVFSGCAKETLNGNEYMMRKGFFSLLSPLDFHQIYFEDTMEFYNIAFNESMVSKEIISAIAKDNTDKVFYLEEEELEEVISLCKLLENEQKKNNRFKNELLKNVLECLLFIILRKSNLKPSKKSTSNPIQNSILYLQLYFKENPSLSQVASYSGFNPNYFSQKFKETVGMTYIDYLVSLKASYAKKLLISSDMSITDICFSSGFTSISNFMRVFKAKYGISPSQYRKQKANK